MIAPTPRAQDDAQPQRLRLLLVDDDPTIRAIAEVALGGDFDVDTVEDPRATIARARAGRPDVIVLDQQMESMDGDEVLLQLRATDDLAGVPVIFLTGTTGQAERLRKLGASGVISKPFAPECLGDDIAEILESAAAGEGAAGMNPDDVIAQLRVDFLSTGGQECGEWLRRLDEERADWVELAQLAHLWTGRGGTLGYPEISDAARALEQRLDAPTTEVRGIDVRADMQALARLFAGRSSRSTPADAPCAQAAALPVEVVDAVRGRRIGLLGFTAPVRDELAAFLDDADAFVRALEWTDLEEGKALEILDLVVVCGSLPERSGELLQATETPLLLVGGRNLLSAWFDGPGDRDFMTSTDDADEMLLRIHRLLSATPGTSPTSADADADADAESEGEVEIVLADDDPTITALLAATLRNHEIGSRVATTGGEALSLIRARRPSAVILDVNMPEADGFEVLAAIRNDPTTRELPVVLLTARQQETDILRGFALGADDYVVKPFNPMELVARLRRLTRS